MKPTKTPVAFNLIFIAVLSLTLGSGGTALHLANQPTLTDQQSRLLDSALDTWKMGTITVIGLLGVGAASQGNDVSG
ncbi:hypothetical protein [Nodosilinea sp. P-1105]|uniref:hypothetical protein n=1 Tax=Nodosilinea sp. P-1105 TaxID=2546229 RepID=UPI00146B1AC3|nr:hypothetical protein [Nodosilinea sp. P-1105]NMF82747.1 hypothetical protein [Nodosilinea sp. P-1105]